MTDTEIVEADVTPPAGLLRGVDPASQAEYAIAVGRALADMATNNGWGVTIQGRDYLKVEGWQFVGSQLGLVPGVEWTKRLTKDTDGIDGWKARCVITHLDSGNVVGSAESVCDRGEETRRRDGTVHYQWRDATDNAIMAMAQTRATSRAFRHILGWAAKSAGFATTPAEEVPDGGFRESNPYGGDEPTIKCPACGAAMNYTPPGKSKSSGKELSGRWWCTDGQNCPGDDSPKFGATLWQDHPDQSFDDARDAWLTQNPEYMTEPVEKDVGEFRMGPGGLQRVADEVMALTGIVPEDPDDPDDPDRVLVVDAVKSAVGVAVARGMFPPSDDGPMAAAMNAPSSIFDELVALAVEVAEREFSSDETEQE